MREEETKKLVDDFLAHHGTKGMRWGVRMASQKAYRSKKAEVNRKHIVKSLAPKGISDSQYQQLGTKDSVIKRGATLNRITKNPNEGLLKGNLFVSVSEKDAEIYRGMLPALGTLGTRKLTYKGYYEVTLKATKNLKSPSEKARVDAFVQLMDVPTIQLTNGSSVTGRQWLRDSGYTHQVRKLDSHELGLKYYDKFTRNQGLKDSPLNSAYFKSLRDKGYNAVIDDNDRKIIAKEPWIVMDANGSLKNLGVKPLTTKAILQAQRNLKFPD